MPIDVEVRNGGAGMVLRCRGVLSGRDLIDVHNGLLGSPEALKDSLYCVVDETAIDGVAISPSDIKIVAELSKRLAKISPSGTLVCIVAPKDVAFGFARMWEVLSQETGWETMTVRSKKEGDTWLRTRLKEKFDLDLNGE
jgi:hypothetical protein